MNRGFSLERDAGQTDVPFVFPNPLVPDLCREEVR